MQLEMIKDRVLIRPIAEPASSRMGVWLPPGARNRSWMAEIVAIGPDALIQTGGLIVGDRVLFHAHRGQELRIGDDFLLVVFADDLFAHAQPEEV